MILHDYIQVDMSQHHSLEPIDAMHILDYLSQTFHFISLHNLLGGCSFDLRVPSVIEFFQVRRPISAITLIELELTEQ
jgi:hypothetical protein